MSFRLKIFAAMLGAQVLLLCVFAWAGLRAVEATTLQIGKEQGSANALLLARTFAEPVVFFDLARIDEALGALVNDPAVLSASVLDAGGNTLASGGTDAPWAIGRLGEDPAAAAALETGQVLYDRSEGRQKFLVPILSGGTLVGLLDLQVRDVGLGAAVYMAERLGATGVLMGLAAALALSYIFSRRLARRLSSLRAAAEALGRGDFSARAELPGNDEIAILARAFDAMAARIQAAQATLETRVRTDHLTGIPNRVAVEEELNRLLAQADRIGARLLHIDLDGFKEVNDTLGHRAGDVVLQEVARRLSAALLNAFEPDRPDVSGFAGRIGGDEFIGIIPDIGDEPALDFSRILIRELSHPITVEDEVVHIGASVGIAHINGQSFKDLEDILAQADVALYEAKRVGGGTAILIDDPLKERLQARKLLVKDVERALQADEFEAFLQPQVDVHTGEIVGVEMLSRWVHPERGIVPPGQFIGLLHGSPLVPQIDTATQRKALAWFGKAKRSRPELSRCRIGFNITELQLSSETFVTDLIWQIDAVDLSPEDIAIEVLENVLVENASDSMHANLRALSSEGFALDLDDFGTGHSAISNLMSFSVDRIKIDRSFISDVDHDPKKQTLVSALVSSGRAFGVSILAEGVENEAELQMVKDLGCTEAQGYGIARPMSFDALEDWLDTRFGRSAPPAHSVTRSTADRHR